MSDTIELMLVCPCCGVNRLRCDCVMDTGGYCRTHPIMGVPLTIIQETDGTRTYLIKCPICGFVCHSPENLLETFMSCNHNPQVPESMKQLGTA